MTMTIEIELSRDSAWIKLPFLGQAHALRGPLEWMHPDRPWFDHWVDDGSHHFFVGRWEITWDPARVMAAYERRNQEARAKHDAEAKAEVAAELEAEAALAAAPVMEPSVT
jgi:hypothetical protein